MPFLSNFNLKSKGPQVFARTPRAGVFSVWYCHYWRDVMRNHLKPGGGLHLQVQTATRIKSPHSISTRRTRLPWWRQVAAPWVGTARVEIHPARLARQDAALWGLDDLVDGKSRPAARHITFHHLYASISRILRKDVGHVAVHSERDSADLSRPRTGHDQSRVFLRRHESGYRNHSVLEFVSEVLSYYRKDEPLTTPLQSSKGRSKNRWCEESNYAKRAR